MIQQTAVRDYCVSGTPTFFVDGKLFGSGERPYADFDKKLREELTRRGIAVPAPAEPAALAPATEAPTPDAPTGEPAPTTPAPPQ